METARINISSQTMMLLREKLRDAQARGSLGVTAASYNVPEWVLRNFCDNPVEHPSYGECVKLLPLLDMPSAVETATSKDQCVVHGDGCSGEFCER